MMTRAACALLLGAGPVLAQQAQDIRYERPPAQNDGWLTGSADSLAAVSTNVRTGCPGA